MKNRIFICPNNDLEAATIIDYLQRNGENVFITNQAWGASWENLEPEIKQVLSENEVALNKNKIYGIELIGGSELKNIENIDHHNENIYKPSSLEQVALVVGEPLSLREEFIGANDSGYIPAMQKLAEEKGLSDIERDSLINDIRLMDRQCQGVTVEQENIAQRFVDNLNISEKQDFIIIDNFPHSKTSTLTDRLYDKQENLLICSTDGEINFFGKPEIVQNLASEFEGWNGKGFWGSTSANKEEVIDFTTFDVCRTIDRASILQVDYDQLENDNNKKIDNDLEI